LITVHVDSFSVSARLEALPAALHERVLQTVMRLAGELVALAQAKAPKKSGRLARSIHSRISDSPRSIRAKVGTSVKYAAAQEFGAHIPAHDLEARKAKALTFMLGGKQVFAAHVRFPGATIPEHSFLRSALRELTPEILSSLEEDSGQVIAG
jgi:phage gpG-like protein